MHAIAHQNELSCHANPLSCGADAPLKDVTDIEAFTNLTNIAILALELKGGCAGNDFHCRELHTPIDDFFCHPIAKVLLIRIIAHVGKRENSD